MPRSQKILGILFLIIGWPLAALAGPEADTIKGIEAYNQGDVVAAMGYYRQAAQAGYAPAQVRLAYILDQSEFDEEAVEWYRKAIAQNSAEARYNLGQMYLSGEGVARDGAKAVELITQAANQGFLRAMRNLAVAYETGGIGLDRSFAKTLEWLRKAAQLDDQWSIKRLARANAKGELGLAVNPDKARQWESRLAGKTQ